ncbi:dephospho-CoA kinase [Allochromatium tepidum]|uniref:Dephospho-CoA kinase n=1 Tax=Allochromatium tepidum TaxID=553982 RepID=A0ABM7QIU6_9GAMM|nr:dephospho-CoA kinase [Allochromatium tepidum]BCU05654.1 dephospho-CoA kinase [Allochromatium tepidum]
MSGVGLVVALTGGIGSGKTTVADRLAVLGAGVIDTDEISRALTARDGAALEPITAVFGPDIRLADGTLDRARLRELVFSDPSARARLESILHPRIEAIMLERLAALQTDYAVLVIPLLFETGQERHADRVLVVDVPESIQIARVMRRSGLSETEVRRIIAGQIPRLERNARADDLVDNSGTRADLEPRLRELHRIYTRMAAAR